MDYLNFDLRLGDWNADARGGVVEVLQSPAGEGQRHAFLLDLNIAATAARSRRTRSMVIELGRKLTNAVLTRESLMLWYNSYQIACDRGCGLRLRLHIDSWDLARLPWEIMYDVRNDDFLAFDPRVSIIRYIRLPATPPALRQATWLKMLVVVASPMDQAQLQWQEELELLRQALRHLELEGKVKLQVCEHTTHGALHQRLLETLPDVVHYIGHAEYDHDQRQGFLGLEDRQGLMERLKAQDAARLFRRYGTSVVVLNSCQTAQGAWAGLAPALVRTDIPAVVAMQWQVEDRAAMLFARSFYETLAQGRTIDECVAEGRVGASTANQDPNDWAAPVLFLRSFSGMLWTRGEARASRFGVGPSARPDAQQHRTLPGPETTPLLDEDVYFKTRGPLSRPIDRELIIDRPEFRRALRIAQQPSVTQYVAILGARQTGKTTVLLNLMSLLEDMYPCVLMDLTILRAQDARSCFRSVAFHLLNELRAILGQEILLQERTQIDTPIDFLNFMRELAQLVPLPRIVILIDEVGALSPQASDTFFNALRTIFTQGRGVATELAKYLFVFGGAIDLSDLTTGNNSPLNICEKLYLQDFELADVRLIVQQFHRLGIATTSDAADAIYSLSHGHPYLTMRLCYLMERIPVTRVSPVEIKRAAEEILMGNDNIRHVIRELDRRPASRRRLMRILNQESVVPFSRNDPTLATLEMIGVIRATQPCQIRNELYARALSQYAASLKESGLHVEEQLDLIQPGLDSTYARLQELRLAALSAVGETRHEQAWDNYAEALFSVVPAFSVYPGAHVESLSRNIVIAIDADREHTEYWSPYQPAGMVTFRDLQHEPKAVLAEAAREANRHNIRLVFVMSGGTEQIEPESKMAWSGTYLGNVFVIVLFDAEIKHVLDVQDDLEAFLRNKVFEARLHAIDGS